MDKPDTEGLIDVYDQARRKHEYSNPKWPSHEATWQAVVEAREALRGALRSSHAREVADKAEITALKAEITAELLGEVMQDAWGEICDDTGCNPLDIRSEGRKLFYDQGHWTRLIAMRLNERRGQVVATDKARIAELEGALRDCADDLEAEVRDRWCYMNGRPHPAMQPKFDRDMQPVDRARSLLGDRVDG